MTKKNIAAMNDIEKVAGGMVIDPTKPYPPNWNDFPPGALASAPNIDALPEPIIDLTDQLNK